VNRIERHFTEGRSERRGLLLPCVTPGTPGSLELLLPALDRAACRLVAVVIPHASSLAFSPEVSAAMARSLNAGMTPKRVFEELSRLREWLETGLIAVVGAGTMGSRPGRFIADAARAGFDGFVFPDLPADGAEEALAATEEHHAPACVPIAPATTPERAELIARASRGMMWMRVGGATGEGRNPGEGGRPGEGVDVASRSATLRSFADIPLVLSGGVSSVGGVSALSRHADAVAVCGAMISRIESAAAKGGDFAAEAERLALELSKGLHQASGAADRQPSGLNA
jgi:tryptophan synthase alpha chain